MAEPDEITDNPSERWKEYFARLGVTPGGFSGLLGQAIEDAGKAPADGGLERFTPLGPRNVGGAVRSIAQHPTVHTTLYAGTAQGGLWRSEDDGYSWKPIGEPDLMLPVGAVAVAPSQGDTIWAGSGDLPLNNPAGNGLYRSEDGGATFKRLAGLDGEGAAHHYTRIVVDPAEPRRAWVASSSGLFRFDNQSATTEALPGVAAGTAITDVALARDPADPNRYVLLAGVQGVGVVRGEFDRKQEKTAWSAVTGLPAGGIGRVRVAFSGTRVGVAPTPWAYVIFEDRGFTGATVVPGYPTVIHRSTDFGRTFSVPAGAAPIDPAPPLPVPPATVRNGQADYCLCLAVDPSDPTRVVAGYVDLFMSVNGGVAWSRILDWTRYDLGNDRAQHADQHDVLFDRRDARHLWVANDGGVSFSADRGGHWRKRSYGIVAAQLTDVTTHPTFPHIFGGGMQDNGTFISVGGPTFYRLVGGDGGLIAFTPNDPRRWFATSQEDVYRVTLRAATGPAPFPQNSTELPDRRDPWVPAPAIPDHVMIPDVTVVPMTPAADPPFVGLVEGDPGTANRLLIGRKRGAGPPPIAGFYSNDGASTAALTTPGISGEVSAIHFAAGAAPDLWLGTTQGELFVLAGLPPAPPAVSAALAARPLPVVQRVTAISVHPGNANVVAVSTVDFGAFFHNGRVYLSHDKGAHWTDISGEPRGIARGPIVSALFHPTDATVLFVGTLAGAYVIRNLPAPPAVAGAVAAFSPQWKSFHAGMPLAQVSDLSITPITRTLRVATYGRGIYECNLEGTTPAAFKIQDVLLNIRSRPIDDGRTYPAANTAPDDPRLPSPAPGFDLTRGFDVRVDAPTFNRSGALPFGGNIDGVEFDELLRSERPLVGDINHVHVQVTNRGTRLATGVQVHLYFADAGSPAAAPAINNAINYPNDPLPTSPWQRAAPLREVALPPGEPLVIRFAWVPPLSIRDNAALLAVCTNAQDPLAAIPNGAATAFVRDERRAALRVMPVQRDTIYIRDGVDDDGTRGAVAWGARSPDIIVTQAAVPNADDKAGPFADLFDPRLADRVRAGNNFVHVRVFNRTQTFVTPRVKVYSVPLARPFPGTGWTEIGDVTLLVPIAPRDWRFASLPWNGVIDPDPATVDFKAFLLMAVAQVPDPAGGDLDPFPDPADVVSFDDFWNFFRSAPLANNAASRALRFASVP